jgi:hypothetical protein
LRAIAGCACVGRIMRDDRSVSRETPKDLRVGLEPRAGPHTADLSEMAIRPSRASRSPHVGGRPTSAAGSTRLARGSNHRRR